jgi:hypothetical protein
LAENSGLRWHSSCSDVIHSSCLKLNSWHNRFLGSIAHVDKIRARLTKKIALCVNGVDLTHLHVGDIMDFDYDNARMMIDSGWAEIVPLDTPLTHPVFPDDQQDRRAS